MTNPDGWRPTHRRSRRRVLRAMSATAASAGVGVVLLLTAVRPLWGGDERASARGTSTDPPVTRIGLAAAPTKTEAPEITTHTTAWNPALDQRWLPILTGIDARRAAAWRTGDVDRLRSVYSPTCHELVVDQRLLRGYLERGLTVSDVHLAFLVVSVERQRPSWVRLLVVDRLRNTVARNGAGQVQSLPHDLPTRHHIELRLVGGHWRIANVTLDG